VCRCISLIRITLIHNLSKYVSCVVDVVLVTDLHHLDDSCASYGAVVMSTLSRKSNLCRQELKRLDAPVVLHKIIHHKYESVGANDCAREAIQLLL